MMDLLVQATTSNKISPSDHTINLISRDERNVQYKPNTPIGSLDANTVYIIPKSTLDLPVKRMPKLANQPFEQQTFRLQVNLPHNQRMVLRVSPRITLDELKKQICSEKELDFNSHHLVHPGQPDTILDLNATLDVYGCAEISLMSNSGLRDSIRSSSTLYAHPSFRQEEERKKKGILSFFSRKKRDFATETPSNGINHLSSSQSDGSTLYRHSYQPKQSVKRKPAPAPPLLRDCSPPLITQSSNSINSRPESEISAKTADEIESSVSHSRHSSDSSGYHEPSVFSDCSENKSPEASILHGEHGCVTDVHRQDSPLQRDHIDSSLQIKRSSMTTRESNLKNVPSCSNVSIISASRKRKAPQPPVSTLPAIESPSSPEAPPIDSVASAGEKTQKVAELENTKDIPSASHSASENNIAGAQNAKHRDSKQQESEALQYLEDVLHESEKLPSSKILDDSDTDSLKDEGEVISVCQAEVHANASDHDSPDSVVEPHTVVAPVPELHKCSFAPLSNLNSQSAGYEESAIPKLVPSDIELPAQSDSAESVNTQNYDSSVCDGAHLKLSDTNSCNCGESEQLPEDRCSSPVNEDSKALDSELFEKRSAMILRTESISSEQDSTDTKTYKNCDKSSTSSISSGSHQNSTTATPQCRKKLDNFVLSSYKKDTIEDIYSAPSDSTTQNPSEKSCLVKSDEKCQTEVPKRKLKSQPDVRIVSLKENTEIDDFDLNKDCNGNVIEKCAQLNKISSLPLTGRCSSMYNLTPQKKIVKSASEESKEVVLHEGMKRTQSDQNFSDELTPVDLKSCFLQEQRRLQEEYQRLQAQFISWQKQLMNNQSLLQSENILPQMPFSSLVGLENLENASKNSVSEYHLNSIEDNVSFDQFKTRSLPRAKTKSLSVKEQPRPKTPPIQPSPAEASVVDIDIGSESVPKRPDTLTSCSVDTQADINLAADKVIQVPSPQDKIVQVPSPPDKVASGVQVPSPESEKSKEDVSAQTSNQNLASLSETDSIYSESEGSKSQTLPRPKPKPVSAFQPSQTMTLNRKTTSKPQAVSVTIGSWQQRQATVTDIEPANVASSRSKFQSLNNIPHSFRKPAPPPIMEKRKLPPVPSEPKPPEKSALLTKDKTSELAKVNKPIKIIRESTKPSGKSSEIVMDPDQIVPDPDETAVKATFSVSKASRHDEKQKFDIKLAAKEPTALFKSAKPFVRLSSMKDESHPPSIIGLKKWPLDISENKGDGRQSILNDLKASSKRPGGIVQDKVRRAEVDLRKPKSTKSESASSTKLKETSVESVKPKILKTESTSSTKVKETPVEPSKLHITKVSINNIKSSEDSKLVVEKKNYSSTITTPVSAQNTSWANTIPKSQSLNTELLAVFSKKANKNSDRYKEVSGAKTPAAEQSITINGSVQPPAPPPPPPPPVQSSSSVMPTIPPAEQIPISSQLVLGRETATHTHKKEPKKSPTKFSRTTDPREELMLEIRGFGGKQALRKIPSAQTGWHLKVFGTASTANS